jgi:hypothetical protein
MSGLTLDKPDASPHAIFLFYPLAFVSHSCDILSSNNDELTEGANDEQ